MKIRRVRIAARALVSALVLVGLAASPGTAGVRVLGSLGARGYGYWDADQTNHLWLMQTTRLAMYQTGGDWSFHFTGGYIGDRADDFSKSGRDRFLQGYVQYGDFSKAMNVRAGRFFLYRGVAIGVFDGADVQVALKRNLKASVYAGLLGPYSRRFEFEDPAKSFSFGGELRWTPASFPFGQRNRFALSFTRQQREEGVLRQRIGLSSYTRVTDNFTWLNVLQMKPTAAPLHKLISRARYNDGNWLGMAEIGIIQPDVEDYSWFRNFAPQTDIRLRLAVDRYLVPEKWGIGLEGAVLMAGGKSGLRMGPALTTPFGQIGYRFSGGEQANAAGPWATLRYSPMAGVDLFAYGAIVSYQWDAFDIETEDLSMLRAGASYTPSFAPDVTLRGEYQVYQSPEFKHDSRALGGLTWRFDTGRGRR